jgi:L-threonylcarbamoyladenylate synthase
MNKKIQKAVTILQSGGIVAYPTDTAYGLAVDATNKQAVKDLYVLKGREFKKPVHVIPPSKTWIEKIVKLNAPAKLLIENLMPGPLTLVLPLKAASPSWKTLSAGTKTLGIRRPKHKLALDLAAGLGRPITTTSANLSGGDNCYSIEEVKKQLKDQKGLELYLIDGGRLKRTKPSTVVLIGKNDVKILREGPITETQIKNVLFRSPNRPRG